jgi:hypothetical protein
VNWLSDHEAKAMDVNPTIAGLVLVCLDPKDGRSVFAELFDHRTEPHFYAFDLLLLEGLGPATVARLKARQRGSPQLKGWPCRKCPPPWSRFSSRSSLW